MLKNLLIYERILQPENKKKNRMSSPPHDEQIVWN
jgi:hypothetical protein